MTSAVHTTGCGNCRRALQRGCLLPSVGLVLRAHRENHDWTPLHVATAAGISEAYLSRIERDYKTKFTFPVLKGVLAAFAGLGHPLPPERALVVIALAIGDRVEAQRIVDLALEVLSA